MKLPLIGLGTWNLRGKECTEVVKKALEIGYRHIDTAHAYENHKAIAIAIRDFKRSKLFITSKIAIEQVNPKKIESSVEKACDLALKELGLEYVDLYLLHWPDREYPLSEIVHSMQKLKKSGKVKQFGVSNFTIHHLEDLFRDGCKPKFNQVEFHPYLYQKELLNFCRSHGVELISYRSLGKGKLLKEPLFKRIGERHEKTGAQVILRWLVQQKIPVIPKASSVKHLEDNFDILNFKLTKEEMVSIGKLHKNLRFCEAGDPELFNY